AIIVVISTLLILRTNTPSAQSSPPQVSAAPATVVPVSTAALGPLPIADDASPGSVGTSSNSSEHANQKMSDPARRTPAPDAVTPQRVQTSAPSPTPHRANPRAPVVQATEQPEPSKGSNAYDERL
ncbi:MAG: hypothetical protein M3O46_19440, partial [Myxococcota bacterium]|nr:hypothetical protein [Myxococcota bacterium]